MVIKGGSRGGARNLAKHLLRSDINEGVSLFELRHVAATDLTGALLDMEAVALGTRARRGLYHASLSTRADERLTPEQWQTAMDRLEGALGFAGHARAAVMHTKAGRTHMHVVWSRIDLARMRAVHDGHNYRKHEEVARELERLFGHARVQGAHAEREGRRRPKRTPSSDEMQQAARTGIAVADVKRTVTRLWHEAEDGAAFVAALAKAGFVLAVGDTRHLVILDAAGGVHGLARRIDGATAAEVNRRLAGIDWAVLPTVAEARKSRATGRIDPAAPAEPQIVVPAVEALHDAMPVSEALANVLEPVALLPVLDVPISEAETPQMPHRGRSGDTLGDALRSVAGWIVGLSRMFQAIGPPAKRAERSTFETDVSPCIAAPSTPKAKVRRSPGLGLLRVLGLRLEDGDKRLVDLRTVVRGLLRPTVTKGPTLQP